MSESLLGGRISSALLGTSDPIRFVDPLRLEYQDDLFEDVRRTPDEKKEVNTSIRYTIVIVIITAIIFISIIALYDVLRTYINNIYSDRTLNELPDISNERREEVLAENKESFQARVTFAAICVILALILVPLLLRLIR